MNSKLEIIIYDIKKQAFVKTLDVIVNDKPEDIKDFLVFDSDKFLILKKNDINFYKF
jgi:hypothetical protein